MRKIVLLIFAIVLCLSQQVMAQGRTVSGRVTEQATGQGLPGVSVAVKGTTTGANTDADGNYTLTIPPNIDQANIVLVIRYVGMSTQEIPLGDRSTVDVALSPDTRQLSEVVVTGYTTQNQREVTGSVSTVKAAEIAQQPIASFDQALQGRAPGVLVQAQSGQPGAPANVVIRGRGSIIGTNSPLFIMDGVEITAADFATLNPNDFESLTVLKDASATSIYGSRGANGVIVITTRKGRAGATRINYDFQYGFSKAPENKEKVMNSPQKLQYELDRGNPYEWTEAEVDSLRQVDTNWEDVLFRNGHTQSHTLSASGGNENTRFFLSGSIFDQTGTVQNTDLKRYTGRANVESKAGSFNFGLNSTFGYSDFNNTTENDAFIGSPLNAVRWANPYETPYDPEGNYTQITSGQPNPLQELLENRRERQQLKGIGNIFVEYAAPFLEGLSLRTNWGGDFTSNETLTFLDPQTYSGRIAIGRAGSLARGYQRIFRYTGTTSAAYTRQFGDHNITVALFQEIVKRKGRNFGFTGFGLRGPFENEAGITPGSADNGFIPTVTGLGSENSLLSYFTDIRYGYKNRYFINVGARRDGSSRFGADRRYANFGSIGFSWILTDEPFLEGLTGNFLTEAKFKISYGSAGNQAIEEDFASRELFGRTAYGGTSGLLLTNLPNPQLQWERRKTFNTGLEATMFDGRLGATVEFYNALTTDLFLNRQLSRTSGFQFLTSNVGELQNRGVELGIQGDIIRTENFTWSANVSLTYNDNEIKELYGETNEIEDGLFINRVGERMNSYFLVRFAGVDPDNGDALYYTRDGETTNVYDPNDRVIVGSIEAPFFGGFGSAVNFAGVEVSAFFSFVRGNKIFNNDRTNIENPDYLFDNLSRALLNEWREPGDITDIPNPNVTFFGETTRFIEDGNFLRLRNLNVSYTLPAGWISPLKMSTVRVFAQGQNLVTWTDFRGYDPEVSTGTLVGSQYPALRTVTFGLNVGF